MTRKERIKNLDISEEERRKYCDVFSEYDENKDKSDPKLLQWWLTELLPKSQLLLERRYDLRQEVKCLFVLVGTSVEPLLLLILTIRPKEKIYLISSSESKVQSIYISNALRRISGGGNILNPDLFSDNVKCYLNDIENIDIRCDIVIKDISPQKVFSVIKENVGTYSHDDVGVDITGGKKSMAGGGYLVAVINNYHLFYVDFDEYIDGYPKSGTEYISILDNPYSIYNIHEESLIKTLWERQDFDAVTEIAGQAIEKLTEAKAEKYGLEKELNRLIQIKSAAQCYREWSRFNYSEAYNSKFYYYENKHDGILMILRDCENKRKNAYGAILLSLDRWQRGVDSLELNDFNKSALCFTQVIEVLCKYRLNDMINQGFVFSQVNLEEIHYDVSSLIKFLWDNKNSNMLIEVLGQGEDVGFRWAQIMRFEKNAEPRSGDLIQKLSIRNKIAHFNCFNQRSNDDDKNEIMNFKNTVRKLIELFILVYQNEENLKGKTFDVLRVQFEFAKYSDFEY